jgi:hypothetical protein
MKKILLSIAVLAGTMVSAQDEPATNSEIAGNVQVNSGTGFELKFNRQGDLSHEGLNCLTNYDFFGKENATYSVDTLADGNGFLKLTFGDTLTVSEASNLNFGANRLPVGNCGIAQSGADGADISNNPVIKARVRATTPVSLILTAATLDGGQWITQDASLETQEIAGDAQWTNVEFVIADTAWNGNGDLGDVIGWEIYIAKGSELSAGEIHFDHITFGATDFATSTNEVVASSLSLFPNPVSDMLTVNFEATSSTSVQLIDLTGKVVRSETAQAGSVSTQFDVNDLNAGVYFVNVKNTVGSTTQKFVVK